MTPHRILIAGAILLASAAGSVQVARADSFFVDPSHYELYNCDQLATARQGVAKRVAELQGLMAKAETGFAGALMSGLAYQSEYVAARGELEQIDQNRERNNCGPLVADKPAPVAKPEPEKKKKKH